MSMSHKRRFSMVNAETRFHPLRLMKKTIRAAQGRANDRFSLLTWQNAPIPYQRALKSLPWSQAYSVWYLLKLLKNERAVEEQEFVGQPVATEELVSEIVEWLNLERLITAEYFLRFSRYLQYNYEILPARFDGPNTKQTERLMDRGRYIARSFLRELTISVAGEYIRHGYMAPAVYVRLSVPRYPFPTWKAWKTHHAGMAEAAAHPLMKFLLTHRLPIDQRVFMWVEKVELSRPEGPEDPEENAGHSVRLRGGHHEQSSWCRPFEVVVQLDRAPREMTQQYKIRGLEATGLSIDIVSDPTTASAAPMLFSMLQAFEFWEADNCSWFQLLMQQTLLPKLPPPTAQTYGRLSTNDVPEPAANSDTDVVVSKSADDEEQQQVTPESTRQQSDDEKCVNFSGMEWVEGMLEDATLSAGMDYTDEVVGALTRAVCTYGTEMFQLAGTHAMKHSRVTTMKKDLQYAYSKQTSSID